MDHFPFVEFCKNEFSVNEFTKEQIKNCLRNLRNE